MDILKRINNPYSFAKPELARVIHTHLKLNVDFSQKVLKGKAILIIERGPSNNEIILDSLGLVISRVTNIDGTRLNHDFGISKVFGSPLHVQLPQAADTTYNSECKIQIEYKTTRNSPALHWLTPAQTADGLYPFLLSENKLIYARTWFPCQDTPRVKSTYTAKILVPKQFTVLMSAHLQNTCKGPELDVYEFRQRVPVPSYAVIIAVGLLKKIQLSVRSNVFVEKKYINESFSTFHSAKIESVLQVAENLCGYYFWDRYDICVLPPSIGHFEIECPCVAFISPGLLLGDRYFISYSLSWNISQSWAGNLVTCANYNHLWLNMSFSIFISRKIICKISNFKDMNFYIQKRALHKLRNTIVKFGNEGLLKCLLPDLTVPEDLATEYVIPYERGCMLLDQLENMLGGPAVFELFLRSYFHKFAFKSISTKDWMDYLYEYFPNKKKLLDRVTWDSWFFNITSPSFMPITTSWETKCFELAKKLVEFDNKNKFINYDITTLLLKSGAHFCDSQQILFLNYLHSFQTDLTTEKLQLLLYLYDFDRQNAEIRFLWLLLCIKARSADKVKSALRFASEFCSPNYACPIFQYLYEWTEMRKIVIEWYIFSKEKMLHETRKELDTILHLTS